MPSWENALQAELESHGFALRTIPFNEIANHPFDKCDYLFARYNESVKVTPNQHRETASKVSAIFPSVEAYEHYDDKIRQHEEVFVPQNLPIPKTVVARDKACEFEFPCVSKKATGSHGINVKLIQSPQEIEPPCILQEYCKDNDGDYRVVCIGHRVYCFKRLNPPNDFRASGSGLFTKTDIIPLASELYKFCEFNKFEVMAFDVMKNNRGQWVVGEMSYTFPIVGAKGETLNDVCDFYLDMRTGSRVQGDIDPVKFICEDFIEKHGLGYKFL